jgi:predicted transposase/invertase (TIGR01784 family)
MEDGTDLWTWMQFLKTNDEEELAMLAQRSPELHKAVGVLMELSADQQTRLLFEAREKAWRDQVDRIEGALEQGLARGLEQGLEQGLAQGLEQGSKNRAIAIAKNMLRRNIPIDEIAEDTGLSIAAIETLTSSD